jgi:hypothetical protein
VSVCYGKWMKMAEMDDLHIVFNGDFPKANYLPGGKI